MFSRTLHVEPDFRSHCASPPCPSLKPWPPAQKWPREFEQWFGETPGTLTDQQWANELHPTPDGFAAIAAKFVDALRLRFPARI